MREPPNRVRIIGHPLVATPIFGLCAVVLYLWSQNPDAIIVGIGAIIAMVWTHRAFETMNQYRAWRRAWDSMAEPGARPSRMPRLINALIAVLAVAGFTLADRGSVTMPEGTVSALVGVALVILPLIVLLALIRRYCGARASRARATIAPVTVAVRRPLFPVPSLEDAYRRLPEHSQQVMRS